LLHRLEVPNEDLTDLAFSPNGRLLAGINRFRRQLSVWDVSTGERRGDEQAGHAAAPSALKFLPNGDRLASAGEDGTIRLWNVSQSKQERVMAHERDSTGYHSRAIRGMDISPNGRLIASSSMDDSVRVWETDTGKERYRLPGHGRYGGNRCVRFTPDGARLVSWGDDMRLYVWDMGSGKAHNEFRIKLSDQSAFRGGYGNLETMGGVLSLDATRLLLLRNDFHLFDNANGKETATLKRADSGHTRFAISPDNQYVIAFSARQGRELPAQGRRQAATHEWIPLVQLLKVVDGELVAEKELAEPSLQLAAFSPDGRQAAITSGHEKPQVLIVSIPEFKEIARIDGLRGPASAVEFSHAGKRLAVSNADTTIVVYDLEKLETKNR
jgi:WD40 repeat protein